MPKQSNQNGAVQVSPRFILSGLVLILVCLAVMIPARPAAANTNLKIIHAVNPVHSYREPSPRTEIVRYLGPGSYVTILCQDYGAITKHGNIWDLVLNPAGYGLDSWVDDYYVASSHKGSFSPELPRCGAALPPPPTGAPTGFSLIKALSRAASQVGRAMGPDGTWWGGMCDHFVAWVNGRASSGYVSAQAHFLNLLHRGLIHNSGTPPAGALVFYNISGSLGHVAWSYGDGNIVTTPALAGQVVYKTGWHHFGSFEGWAWPNPEWFT